MKTALKIAAGVGALSALATGAHAQNSASATASSSVSIVQGIAITNTKPLAFGTIVGGAAAGTVTLSSGGVFSQTGNVPPLGTGQSAAAFPVAGDPSRAFSLTIPTSFTLAGASASLVVTTLPSGTGTQSLNTSGTYALTVGGSFPLAAAQATGAYTGSFAVTVQYN